MFMLPGRSQRYATYAPYLTVDILYNKVTTYVVIRMSKVDLSVVHLFSLCQETVVILRRKTNFRFDLM